MDSPLQNPAMEPGTQRVFGVVAPTENMARELMRCLVRQGDRVQTLWYPDSSRLIADAETRRFEAVVLFAPEDCIEGDREEMELRGAFRGLPLYRL
jgi:hypothetical protein